MKVACVIPVHNEEGVLEGAVRAACAWGRDRFGDDFTLVVSENGSTDRTEQIAHALARELRDVRVVASREAGKGGAIKRGMAAVEADAYLMMDVDLSTDLESAARIVDLVLSGSDIVIGSRRMRDSQVTRSAGRRFVTSAYAAFADAALGLGVRDLQCGCKGLSRRVRDVVVPAVVDDGWFFDTELLAVAKAAKLPIVEVGVRWTDRSSAGRESKVRVLPLAAEFAGKLLALRSRSREV